MTFWKNRLLTSFYGKPIIWQYIEDPFLKFIFTFVLVMGNILSKAAMNNDWSEEEEITMDASEGGKDYVFDPPDPSTMEFFVPPVTSSPLPEEISVDLEEENKEGKKRQREEEEEEGEDKREEEREEEGEGASGPPEEESPHDKLSLVYNECRAYTSKEKRRKMEERWELNLEKRREIHNLKFKLLKESYDKLKKIEDRDMELLKMIQICQVIDKLRKM